MVLRGSSISTTSWVRNYGTEYCIGMFVFTSTEDEMFKKIVNIIIKDDDAFLLITKVITMYFDDHLNGL